MEGRNQEGTYFLGRQSRRATFKPSLRYPEQTRPWWCRVLQHSTPKKGISFQPLNPGGHTSHSGASTSTQWLWCHHHSLDPRLNSYPSKTAWSPSPVSTGRDGCLRPECFLCSLFSGFSPLPTTIGTKTSLSLDHTQFICKCQNGTN